MIGQAETKKLQEWRKIQLTKLGSQRNTKKTTAGNAVVFILLLKLHVKFHQYQRKSYSCLLANNYLAFSATSYPFTNNSVI